MILTKQIFESKHVNRDNWETPPDLYDELNREFHFTLDPCARIETAKAGKYYTRMENGLLFDWRGENVFVNPPYSGTNCKQWVEKCFHESQKPKTKVVALLPVSTSSRWFHDFIYNKAEVRFLKGRIRFVGAPYTAPFSSMIVIW
jgi:phage N-6-adenine-methyltransferase